MNEIPEYPHGLPYRRPKRRARGEIIVDSRGRTNLSRVRTQQHTRYMVNELPDGTLVLTPAVLVPAHLLRPGPPDRSMAAHAAPPPKGTGQ